MDKESMEFADFVIAEFGAYGGHISVNPDCPKRWKATRRVDVGIIEIVGSYDTLEELILNIELYLEGVK